jgi:hypothetical protein
MLSLGINNTMRCCPTPCGHHHHGHRDRLDVYGYGAAYGLGGYGPYGLGGYGAYGLGGYGAAYGLGLYGGYGRYGLGYGYGYLGLY